MAKIGVRVVFRCFALLALGLLLGCTGGSSSIKGKVLRLVLKDAVKTSDPTNAYDVVSTEVIDQIYDSVLQYDYFSDTLKLAPSLTEGMPQVSKDGKTYTLRFRKDLRFQDDPCFKESAGKGRAVTTEDFLYAWKRHANPANESQAFWIWDGKVAGIGDFQKKFRQGKPDTAVMKETVEGFRKIDDHTIEIRLVKAYPQLLYILAMHFTAPVPHEAVETYGKDFVNHPVGTGPYKVQSWNPTSRIVLVKNGNYRDERFPDTAKLSPSMTRFSKYTGAKIPLADAIEFNVVKEDQPRWLGFLAGNFDQIEIPKDNFSTAMKGDAVLPALAAKGVGVSIEPAYSFWYVTFNMKDKVLGANKALRQAIASAIDAKAWLEIFKNGRGTTQSEVNPPSILDRCGKPYRWIYDVERAKKLLGKAGFPGGKGLPVLRWDTRGAELSERQLAEFIQKNLAAIGIQIEINTNTFPAYLDKMNKGALQISKGGWVMDYPDAENNMQLLYGPNKSPGPNDSNFDNAEYNELYEKFAAMPSGAERRAILCKMEEIIQEEAPWAYGIFENEYRLVQKWVPGYRTSELVMNKYKFIDTERVAR